jgi:hypothetical protein
MWVLCALDSHSQLLSGIWWLWFLRRRQKWRRRPRDALIGTGAQGRRSRLRMVKQRDHQRRLLDNTNHSMLQSNTGRHFQPCQGRNRCSNRSPMILSP